MNVELQCEVCRRPDHELEEPILAYRGVEDDASTVIVLVCRDCAERDGLRVPPPRRAR